jgi:hypothetical protein
MALPAGDSLWYYKVLGLHCDGTNGSTTFTDVKGKAVTAVGNAQISTAQYPSLTGNSSSGYVDGTGDYLTVPDSTDWDFGTGDFGVRIRARFSGVSTLQALISNYQNSTTGFSMVFDGVNSKLQFLNGTTALLDVAWSPSADTWYVIEVSRSGTSLRGFVGGTQVGSTATNSTSITGSTSTLFVGARDSSNQLLTGYFSEVEIYKGAPLNTANYTPSSDPFPNTYLQISGIVQDAGGNFVTKLLRAYSVSTGYLVANVLSRSADGTYEVTALNSDKHFVVLHDNPITSAENVVLAMPFDLEYGSLTTIRDLCGNVFTRNGSATLSSTKAKFGTYSFYNGATTSDYITAPSTTNFDVTSPTPFTVSFWVNTTLYDAGYTRGLFNLFTITDTAGTGIYIGYYQGALVTHLGTDSLRIDDGAWHHIELSVTATTTYSFVDGNLRQSGARAANTYNSARKITIGNFSNYDTNRAFVGYIDGLVMWKGVALHTTTFTPPARFLIEDTATENAQIYDNITPY